MMCMTFGKNQEQFSICVYWLDLKGNATQYRDQGLGIASKKLGLNEIGIGVHYMG